MPLPAHHPLHPLNYFATFGNALPEAVSFTYFNLEGTNGTTSNFRRMGSRRHQMPGAVVVQRGFALMRSVKARDLVLVTTGPSGSVEEQIRRILGVCGTDTRLCTLRVFHTDRDCDEASLTRRIASALPRNAAVVLTFVPVPSYGLSEGGFGIEAMGVTGAEMGKVHVARGLSAFDPFVAGLRCGRYFFIGAQRASRSSSLIAETKEVMEALSQTLSELGVHFSDIVRMNRWYHADGTKAAWAPPAQLVAGFYQEPGPVATAISLAVPFQAGLSLQIELLGMVATDGTPFPKSHSWPDDHWDWPIHLPYKHGLLCEGLIFVGGQVSLDARAEVIDPERLDLQIARSLKNIDRVLEGFSGRSKRMLHLDAYYQVLTSVDADLNSGSLALKHLAAGVSPVTLVGFRNLSYPQMRVEIEAIAEIT